MNLFARRDARTARSSLPRALRLAAAALLLLLARTPKTEAAPADETLALAVTINGHVTGKIGEFLLHGQALFAMPSELAQLGLRLPAGVVPGPDGRVALSAVKDLVWRLDQPSQTLFLTVPDALLQPTLLDVAASPSAPSAVESGMGTTLNYDMVGNLSDGRGTGSGAFDLRGFSPWGVASTSMLGYAGATPSGAGGVSAIRLDSGYAYADPETLRRYRLGDVIAGSVSWSRPVRMGGIQIQSDFSLRPDLITFPLPTIGGQAAVPSTVDVLVNNAQLLSRQVGPGPFQVSQLPLVTGADTVTTTVTNALGQQVTTSMPFYASSELLAPGLQSYSAELGWVRQNWGVRSDDYARLAGSGTWRQGLSQDFTGEIHAEATGGLAMGGLGIAANAFNLGTVNLAAAASSGQGRDGGQVSFGAERIGQVFSLGGAAIFSSPGFRDIAAISGQPVPRRQISANIGLALGRLGSFGVAYTGLDRDAGTVPIILGGTGGLYIPGLSGANGNGSGSDLVSFLPAQHAHVVSVSYSAQVGNLSFYATGFADLAQGGSSGAMLGLTLPLGPRSSASADLGTGGGGDYAQLQAQQTPVTVGDWGYQADVTSGRPDHEFGQVQYKSPWGLVSAGADRLGGQTTLRAEGQGALSLVDDGLFASNSIQDSFAVVDTGGVAGIRVMEENRDVGRTDSDGQVLVPDLRAFDVNHIAIDPTDVPVGETLPFDTRTVRPQDRSGVVVPFPIAPSRAALLRLVDRNGLPVPVGSAATLAATGASVPVGYEGEAYLEHLMPGPNRLEVLETDGHRCTVDFDYQAGSGAPPMLGPLPCREQ